MIGRFLAFTMSSISISIVPASSEVDQKELGAIWFVGDSITQGNADRDPEGSPRKALYDLLDGKGYKFSFTGHYAKNVDGLPETGATVGENLFHYHSGVSGILIGDENREGMSSILEKSWTSGRLAEVKPNIILIMLGTNDVGRGYELDKAPDRLRALLEQIYSFPAIAQPKVFLASIPPNRRIEVERTNVMVFNESVPEIVDEFRAKGRDIYFVDQFTPIENAYEANMCPDNLHPNGTGNETMARQWFEAIEESLETAEGGGSVDSRSGGALPGEMSDFQGFDSYRFLTESGVPVKVIAPKEAAAGKPWLWRSLFWEAVPKFRDADLKLVEQGYHVVLVHGDVSGHPSGNANIDAAYELLTEEYGFSKKCSMASMSRGTLSLFRWGTENPEKVSSIYVDNGVCNLMSWPAGKLVPGNDSVGSGDHAAWEYFKEKFGFATDQEALASKESPIDLLRPLAEANVPILLVCGSKDQAVPYEENDAIMEERYKALGGSIEVIIEEKGHSHGMDDPTPVIDFIKEHTH